jgi:hypothetical protein
VIGYRPDEPRPRGARAEAGTGRNRAEEDAFDRAEVERELAALGFRDAGRGREVEDEDPADEDLPPSPFRPNRVDDPNRGLLHRLIDVRKQP